MAKKREDMTPAEKAADTRAKKQDKRDAKALEAREALILAHAGFTTAQVDAIRLIVKNATS